MGQYTGIGHLPGHLVPTAAPTLVHFDVVAVLDDRSRTEVTVLEDVPFFQVKSYMSNAVLNGVWVHEGPDWGVVYPIQRIKYFLFKKTGQEESEGDEETISEVSEGELSEDHGTGPGDGSLQ